jgi:OOP family OmpA-OmpF porin
MKRWLLTAGTALFLILPGAALAQPAGLAHVDPKAPCFRWPAVDTDGDGVFDRVDHCVSTKKGCVVDQYGCSSDGDRDGVCDGLDRCPNTPAGAPVDEWGCSPGTAAPEPPPSPPVPAKPRSEAERQLVERGSIRLENIYFETGSAELLSESEASLREAGEALERFPDLKIEVQGHTDTRGKARYNQNLSQARAEAVRAFLLGHFKLASENLVAKGYGENDPETKERNDEELLRNRRVVLRVLNPEALPKNVKVKVEEKR